MRKDNLQNLNIELQKLYKQLETNRKFYNSTLNRLSKRIELMKLIDIFTNKEFRYDLTTSDIYWLYKNYNELREDNKLLNRNFFKELKFDFTEREVNNAEMLLIDNSTKDDSTIEINRVIEVVEDREYLVAKVTAKELGNIFKVVSWNPFSQRETTIKTIRGFGKVEIPTIYRKNVDEIKQKMLSGEFFSNMISLNILKTEEASERYEYNSDTQILRFTRDKGSVLDCIDGFQRLVAISELVHEYPKMIDEIYMQLKIWIMDISEATLFINREASRRVLSAEKKKITANDLYISIVRELSLKGDFRKNALLNKVGELEEVKNKYKFYTMDLFRETLSDNIILNDIREANSLSRFLKNIWNEVIFANENLFDLKKINDSSAINKNNILAFFNYIAVKIFNNKDLEDDYINIINDILENVDFNIETNLRWKNIKIDSKRYDKSIRKNIYIYANEVLESMVK